MDLIQILIRNKRFQILFSMAILIPILGIFIQYSPKVPLSSDHISTVPLLILTIAGLVVIPLYLTFAIKITRNAIGIPDEHFFKTVLYILHYYILIAIIIITVSLAHFSLIFFYSSGYMIEIGGIHFSPVAYFYALTYCYFTMAAYAYFLFAYHIYKMRSPIVRDTYFTITVLNVIFLLINKNGYANHVEYNVIVKVPKIIALILMLIPAIMVAYRSFLVIRKTSDYTLLRRHKILFFSNLLIVFSIITLIIQKIFFMKFWDIYYVVGYFLLLLGLFGIYYAFF